VTHVIEPAPPGGLAEALEEVRRSAQQLLADVGHQPRLLRIRAGEVVVELEWNGDSPAGRPAPPVTEPETDGLVAVCSPTVGTFYRAPEPGAAPFVAEGAPVRRGQQLGIVEAMKLMIPVEAEHDGTVVTVHVADGTAVEYGERLVTLDPGA
jgi:acetyl-CoA carboxylase biotin carboxyl carrier protein